MHGKPDCRLTWIGPSHAMARVRRDMDIVAAPKHAGYGLAIEQNTG
jgi:hypothetical protein